MIHPARTFKDLSFLIPPDIRSPSEIIKTMVFLDGLSEACNLASTLIELIPKHLYEDEPDLVAEYTNGLTAKRQSYSMDLFQKGICRILVCTEACGMGVDVADVERVVQWGITPRVNLSMIMQRMGRAARKSHIQGVGILFHTTNNVITEKHVVEAQKYLRSSTHPEYSEVLSEIMKYDLGIESDQRSTRRTRPQPQNSSGRGAQLKDFPSHCRATLSLINTPGCRRHIILTYFGETPNDTNPVCCDHCLGPILSPGLRRLIPPQLPSRRGVSRIAAQTPTANLLKRNKLAPAIQHQIIEEIKLKRRNIWHSLGGNKRFSPYAAGALMTEKDITILSSKSLSITTPEQVPKTLGVLNHKYISSAHEQLWANTFDIISSSVHEPRINNSDTLPPPNIPPTNIPTPGIPTPGVPPPSITPAAHTILQEITPSTNNRIATHTSTGKARKLTKAGLPRKVRSDFGKPKKKDDSRNPT